MTGSISLGWGNKSIENKIIKQVKRISHIDYKSFQDENREILKQIILQNKKNKLNDIYFSGQSGAEANEGAMKLSYQLHKALGRKKNVGFYLENRVFMEALQMQLLLGKKNLFLFKDFYPKFRVKIKEHNIYRHKKKFENENEYTTRSVQDLEKQIKKIGPENICAFMGETMMGGLVGDVPPTKEYWKKVRKICDKYNIHLICDEIWCGAGTTGKNFVLIGMI